jgi:flavin-dependent dehydrogenase
MPKEYDLVVVGAGPAELMATKTAGENGLNVALIERKKHIPEINRSCSMMLVSLGGEYLGERILLNTREKLILIKKPLPNIFDPYETPKLIGGALAEVMPVIAREKPRIIKKLNQMRSIPLEKIFEGCIRAGFPFRPH